MTDLNRVESFKASDVDGQPSTAPTTNSKEIPSLPSPEALKKVVWVDGNNSRPQSASLMRTPRGSKTEKDEIEVEFLLTHLKEFVSDGKLMRDFTYFVPFIVMFIFFFLYGREITTNYYAQKAIKDAFLRKTFPDSKEQIATLTSQLPQGPYDVAPDKSFSSIRTPIEWVQWYKATIIPSLWDCSGNTVDETLRKFKPFAFAGQLYPLGSLRVRTQMVTNTSCQVQDALYRANTTAFPRPCYGEASKSSNLQKNTRCYFSHPLRPGDKLYRYKKCDDVPGTYTTGYLGEYDCGGYYVEIPFDSTCHDALRFVDIFSDTSCPLIDLQSTRFVIVEFFMYSASIDSYQSVKMILEISPGGYFVTSYQIHNFNVWTQKNVGQTVFDFFFLLVVLIVSSKFVREWVKDYQATSSLIHYYTSLWNLLDLVNVACIFTSFVLRWIWWARSRVSERALPFTSYPLDLDALLFVYSQQVYINSVNTVITFLKILKYAELNDHLAVLTRTLAVAKENMIGLVVLFVLFVTGFAITGHGLFGETLYGFRSVDSAYGTLIRMLIGEFDYESMKESSHALASIYFWSYMIFSNFLILNFIVAVVCEGFSAVNEGVGHTSMADDIRRTVNLWIRMLKPANFKRKVKLWMTGTSDLQVADTLLSYLIEHRNMLLQTHTESLMVFRSDFKSILPPEVYEKAEGFIELHWVDFRSAYENYENSEGRINTEEFENSIIEGVDNTICKGVSDIADLAPVMERFDVIGKEVLSKLKKKR